MADWNETVVAPGCQEAKALARTFHPSLKQNHYILNKKTRGDKEKKMTLSSVDMAEAHALTLRKGSDLAFSLQLSSVCMYENRFISGLESFS